MPFALAARPGAARKCERSRCINIGTIDSVRFASKQKSLIERVTELQLLNFRAASTIVERDDNEETCCLSRYDRCARNAYIYFGSQCLR